MDAQGHHKLFFRGVKQDDAINGLPQFPGQDPRTTRVNKNFGYALGFDSVLSTILVNTFRYGLSKIDEATIGRRTSDAVTFRFIDDLDPLTATESRQVPTQNFVDDLSWLKGNHTVKFGTNIRFTRNPQSSNANSFHTGNLNPSWVDRHRSEVHAGWRHVHDTGLYPCLPSRQLLVRLWRSMAHVAGGHLAADRAIQLRP